MNFFDFYKEQVKIIRERDPAIHSNLEVLLYSSFWAIYWYRKAHKLYMNGHFFWARVLSQHAVRRTGIEIHPGAKIGSGFFIDHGAGVIIGETTIIGNNVTLYQGVTLGGTGKEHGKRHPTIEDNVMISTGAKVLGSFTIGANSKIGAGSVVLSEVPPYSTVVGVPGRVVKNTNPDYIPSKELNQTDLPDPIDDDICNLKYADAQITNHIIELEQQIRELKRIKCQVCDREDDKKGDVNS
ncbi:MAG: serine O-acetyltransferase [Lachnospiraceae bacterium]|nr:serine O-acetyltransferase [Lachnospiraceae bacterium]